MSMSCCLLAVVVRSWELGSVACCVRAHVCCALLLQTSTMSTAQASHACMLAE
jgi:hypothetical protein